MARREFLQLAQKFDPAKDYVAGASFSPKLDGLRAFWDGGITAGLATTDVPWANTLRDAKVKYSTGLWSRLGKPIIAHPDWLRKLPQGLPLDGELYLGKSALEETMAVKRDIPDPKLWAEVTYQVFDTPSLAMFDDGEVVYDAKTRKKVNFGVFQPQFITGRMMRFIDRHLFLQRTLFNMGIAVVAPNGSAECTDVIKLVPHTVLSHTEHIARDQLYEAFDAYTASGGEGLMLRMPNDLWVPRRVGTLLKFKPLLEDVGTIIGYYAGEIGVDETLRGKMGAVLVQWGDVTFKMSGFTHGERDVRLALSVEGMGYGQSPYDWAWGHPGAKFPDDFSMPEPFALGSIIPFRYTSLTAAGVPREARYDRPSD